LGIVSDHFRHHSVWHAIIKGWLSHLDHSQFEIHLFHLSNSEDINTEFAKERATSFISKQSSLLAWANSILDKNIEALIYPEIGMNQLATQLANLRLAPIQIVAWGHPETSGLPTMDYYLSAELFETEGSDGAYSEKLIPLPNLGCSYSRLPVGASDFDLVSIVPKSDSAIFVCPGMLFKYAPENDWIFASIAKKVGKCQFIFFYEHNRLAEILKARLKKVFEEEDLEVDHYVFFIPLLARENFYGLLKRCDVFLDTIGFSGFNTAIQAIDCGLPIVTKGGAFMRGRLASGILKRIALDECIATTDQEYIELAVRLAQDRPYRDQVISKMNKNRDILYDDLEPIRALEEFLTERCRG
jgi:predicted O-linked N-acetylglucosamine transferase (SPINDLY family)